MSDHEQDISRDRMPWLRSGFDLEGYVGALAAWLVGVLLGLLWSPLFWIGFVAAVVILLATRTATRTAPQGEGLIVAPCDGIVVSVGGATPPSELRLEGSGWTRIRVSLGPMCSNGLHASIDGAVDHIIRETGDPAAFAATKVDRPGLAVAYVALESGDRAVGMRLATGGLGPRLEIHAEPGDAVRLGRTIGTMRLGGWCDIYIQSGAGIAIAPGQTLIGSETILARFDSAESAPSMPEPAAETEDIGEAESVEEGTAADEDLNLETSDDPDGDDPSDADDEEDVSEMFARLRKEARKAGDGEE